MNEYDRLYRIAKVLRESYPQGTRVEPVDMNDAHAVPSGTRGTVRGVDDMATIYVVWDNGSTLGVAYSQFLCC